MGLGRYGAQLQSLYAEFPREQVLVLLYRDVRERPVETLDRICAFIGVQTGLLDAMAPRNVTVQVGAQRSDEAVAHVLRAVSASRLLPAPVRGSATAPLARVLQRRQRTRTAATPEERQALLPLLEDDIRLAERLTGLCLAH